MKIAVCGPKGFGSWRARGAVLARAHGWETLDCRKPVPRKYDTIWLVKRLQGHPLPVNLRDACDRLIVDPLDYWASPTATDPYACWQTLWEELHFDDLIATSPASHRAMVQGLKRAVPVHLIPHSCDPRIPPGWHDPAGPLVYAGSRCFVGKYQDVLRDAAGRLGRELRFDFSQHHSWRSLQGAALQICLRFPPHECAWNRIHRPQIKLENSAAAGIPLIYNGHDCETSLHPGHVTFDVAGSPDGQRLARAFQQALDSTPPKSCYRAETFLDDAARLVLGTTAETLADQTPSLLTKLFESQSSQIQAERT